MAFYIVYVFFKLERFISSRIACMFSLASLILFHLITYSWPFIPGHVAMHNSTTLDTNATVNEDNVGCDTDKFDWCDDLRPVNVYLYYTMYIITIGIAYPMLNITVATLLSKILGPRPQGTQQGIFQASGSFSRVIGPIGVSTLYVAFGPRMAWNLEIIVIAVTLVSWIVCYKRMVPLKMPIRTETSSESEGPVQTEVNRRQSIFNGV
uniref:MFS domain-containing protein n=1 Tax=Panagrellus redivivus TaxID=6233 RepID=A0A7E4VXY0_PANRE